MAVIPRNGAEADLLPERADVFGHRSAEKRDQKDLPPGRVLKTYENKRQQHRAHAVGDAQMSQHKRAAAFDIAVFDQTPERFDRVADVAPDRKDPDILSEIKLHFHILTSFRKSHYGLYDTRVF